MTQLLTITGTVECIRLEKQFRDSYMVEFVVSRTNTQRIHHYLLRAMTRGTHDGFNIAQYIGHQIQAECYLNGRKSEGLKGVFYQNELHVKTITHDR